jgi:hypothetical protein
LRLLERGARVVLWDESKEKSEQAVALLSGWTKLDGSLMKSHVSRLQPEEQGVDILVGTALRQPVISASLIECLKDGGMVMDAGVGTLTPEAIDAAVSRGLRLYRLDMRAGLSGQITVGLETLGLVTKVIGQGQVAGVDVVAGGMIGKRGTIVLDAIGEPTRVIGVADGHGHLLDAREAAAYERVIVQVKAELVRRRLP